MKKILYFMLIFSFLISGISFGRSSSYNVNAKNFEFGIENKAVMWAGGCIGIRYYFSHFNIMYMTQADIDAKRPPRMVNAMQFALGPNMWLVSDATRNIMLSGVDSSEKVFITIPAIVAKAKNKIHTEVKLPWGKGVGFKEISSGDIIKIQAYGSSYEKNGCRYQETSFKCVLPGKWDSTK